MPDKPGLVDL